MCDNLTDVRDLMCNLELFLCDQKKLNSVLLFEINDIFRINNWKIVFAKLDAIPLRVLRFEIFETGKDGVTRYIKNR